MNNFLLIFFTFIFSLGCTHFNSAGKFKSAQDYSKSNEFKPGKLVIIQGPTSNTDANINVLAPRLKNYKYIVTDDKGQSAVVEKYETVQPDILHWKVDKIYITGLSPNINYTLKIIDEFRSSSTIVDSRKFQTLDIEKNTAKFAYASCMADDYRFTEVIDPMWNRMQKLNPDFIVLNGDVVYVDSFEFVERQKATELDIWMRFIDSMNRLPVYKWLNLKPIFATWDDHDFGTNDGDRNFISKQAARKIFLAFYGGKDIKNVYKLENESVYFSFNAFKQKMLFLDDRYFRQPNKDQQVAENFAQWGEKQHKWIFEQLNQDATPTWLFNGNQFFSGVDLSYKESFQSNSPVHFKGFLEEMKKAKAATILASGDIHFSEIMALPAEQMGFASYEITSSSMHSYTGSGWDNPLRLTGAFTKEFNFIMINSLSENSGLKINVEAWGLDDKPYFKNSLEVKR